MIQEVSMLLTSFWDYELPKEITVFPGQTYIKQVIRLKFKSTNQRNDLAKRGERWNNMRGSILKCNNMTVFFFFN